MLKLYLPAELKHSPVAAIVSFLAHYASAYRRIGVAVSGGADSVVLLHILHQLRGHLELHVLHVNHHLRGPDSDADEAFVRNLAASLELPITVEQATAPVSQIEKEARNLRRAFFTRARQELNLGAVALGHNRSDQAETVLFRLLRGSGLTGLAGMRPVTQAHLIRPLLACSRQEIRTWAQAQNITWREDYTNSDVGFRRNQLRLESLPDLADKYNPQLEAALAQVAELAQTEEDYWATEVRKVAANLLRKTPLGWQIGVGQLAALPLALRRRLLRHAVEALRGHLNAIEFDHVEAILHLCRATDGHDRVMIPGVDALRSFDQLLLSPPNLRSSQERDYAIPLRLGEEYELPYNAGFLSVSLLKSEASPDIYANFKEEQLKKIEICQWGGDFLAPGGTLPFLCARNWRPGDVFQQAGHESVEKIKTLFQSGKVLLWERKHWPVVTAGDKIIWVRQFGGFRSLNEDAERSRRGSSTIFQLVYRQV